MFLKNLYVSENKSVNMTAAGVAGVANKFKLALIQLAVGIKNYFLL